MALSARSVSRSNDGRSNRIGDTGVKASSIVGVIGSSEATSSSRGANSETAARGQTAVTVIVADHNRIGGKASKHWLGTGGQDTRLLTAVARANSAEWSWGDCRSDSSRSVRSWLRGVASIEASGVLVGSRNKAACSLRTAGRKLARGVKAVAFIATDGHRISGSANHCGSQIARRDAHVFASVASVGYRLARRGGLGGGSNRCGANGARTLGAKRRATIGRDASDMWSRACHNVHRTVHTSAGTAAGITEPRLVSGAHGLVDTIIDAGGITAAGFNEGAVPLNVALLIHRCNGDNGSSCGIRSDLS